jgi:hypothetical protein
MEVNGISASAGGGRREISSGIASSLKSPASGLRPGVPKYLAPFLRWDTCMAPASA